MNASISHRAYIEKAFFICQKYVSNQTGFVHVSKDIYAHSVVQVAPSEENFLYALLLLRKKTKESIQEGKDRLRRLFAFQNCDEKSDQYGNFPCYLTDYPQCTDWILPLRLLIVFQLIEHSFELVLGNEFIGQLHECMERLNRCIEHNRQKVQYPFWARFFLGQNQEYDGVLFFEEQREISPQDCAYLLLRSFLCGESVFSRAFVAASSFVRFNTYVGPPWGIFSYKAGPQVTLFDLLLGDDAEAKNFLSKEWPYKTAFEAALLVDPPSSRPTHLQSFAKGPVVVSHQDDVSVAVVLSPPKHKGVYGFHPARLVFPHMTIVIHVPCAYMKSVDIGPRTIDFAFEGGEDVHDDGVLCSVYTEKARPTIYGERGTIFDVRDGVELSPWRIRFETAVQTLGRISLSNRPGQLCSKGHDRKEAYDWKIEVVYLRGALPSLCHIVFEK